MRRRWKIGMVIAAFTLVSVLVGIPAFFSSLDGTPTARRHKAQADLASLAMLVDEFHSRNNRSPRDEEGVTAVIGFGTNLNQAPERHPIDPWGKPYVYRARADGRPELY